MRSMTAPSTCRASCSREWEARDPVIGFRRKLAAAAYRTKQLDEIDRRCREEVEDAVAFAEASPWPDPSTVTRGVYAVSQEPSVG